MSLKLEDYIVEGEKSIRSTGFPNTMRGMIKTGFQEWGFVIYRCVYGDDEAWQQYMDYFVEDVIEGLKHSGGHIIATHAHQKQHLTDKANCSSSHTVTTVRQMDRHG